MNLQAKQVLCTSEAGAVHKRILWTILQGWPRLPVFATHSVQLWLVYGKRFLVFSAVTHRVCFLQDAVRSVPIHV